LNSAQSIIALPVFNCRIQVLIFGDLLRQQVIGNVLGQAFTFRKGELHFPLSGNSEFSELVFAFQPPLPFFNLNRQAARPRERVNLLNNCTGLTITGVMYHTHDRMILMRLADDKYFLILQLYGINGNVLLFDAEHHLIDSFRKVKNSPQIAWEDFRLERKTELNWTTFLESCQVQAGLSLSQFLNQGEMGVYSKTFIAECTYHLNCSERTPIATLDLFSRRKLFDLLQNLFAASRNPQYFIYTGQPPRLTFLPLVSLGSIVPLTLGDYSTAVGTFVSQYRHWYTTERKKSEMLRKIEWQRFTLTRKIQKQQKELKNIGTAERYRQWGDLIMANLSLLKRGLSSVTLPSLAMDKSEPITISMNPRLSPVENAEKFYERARRITQSRNQLEKSISTNQVRLQQLGQLQEQVIHSSDQEALEQSAKILLNKASTGKDTKGEHLPYFHFQSDGWDILVGKSARDNDILTLQLARPADYWFHAQNITGSHVLVRNPHKAGLPHAIIVKAAAIAAYYSKARNSKLVPVIYTQKKYVSKPRQSAPGAVAVKFEKVIFVEPWNPNNQENSD